MLPFTITPGWIDAILVGVAIELGALSMMLARASAARWIGPLLLYLASGAFLLIALRVALAGSDPAWIALALLASLLAHGASLWSLRRALFGALSGALSGESGARR